LGKYLAVSLASVLGTQRKKRTVGSLTMLIAKKKEIHILSNKDVKDSCVNVLKSDIRQEFCVASFVLDNKHLLNRFLQRHNFPRITEEGFEKLKKSKMYKYLI